MKSVIDVAMKSAEHREKHIPRTPRPHLAQEFRERGQLDHAESITYFLMPHARMCAEGKTSRPKRYAR